MLTELQEKLIKTAADAFGLETARMLVLSKPQEKSVTKIKLVRKSSAKGIIHVLETYMPDGRITQKNSDVFPTDALRECLDRFEQADLITENGDALYKKSRKGKEMLTVSPKLRSALGGGEVKKAECVGDLKSEKEISSGKAREIKTTAFTYKEDADFTGIKLTGSAVISLVHTLSEKKELNFNDFKSELCALEETEEFFKSYGKIKSVYPI